MATEQACGIALNSGYWTSEVLSLCRSQIFPGITSFFIFWNSKFWYAPRCERLSDQSFKLATEKRKSIFFTKKILEEFKVLVGKPKLQHMILSQWNTQPNETKRNKMQEVGTLSSLPFPQHLHYLCLLKEECSKLNTYLSLTF